MAEDEQLRDECNRVLRSLVVVEVLADGDDNERETERNVTKLMALCKRQQAVGLREAADEFTQRQKNCQIAITNFNLSSPLWFWEEREKCGWKANETMLKHLVEWCLGKAKERET